MIRILFVDDEPMILDGLRRMLRSQRCVWDMSFVGGGEEALRAMDEEPFEVVVTDMKMPGMDGAELLAHVKERHPESIRIILSGHAEERTIMSVVDSCHQFLSKPCDSEVLRATIERATTLRRVLANPRLASIVSQMSFLPSLPRLYRQVAQEIQAPEPSLRRIAAILETDVGMSATVLKLVNSAFFGRRRRVTDVREAVTALGLDTVGSLVLGRGVFQEYQIPASLPLSAEALWAHSVKTGRFAQLIARLEDMDRDLVGGAFSAGLLHDVGKLVLATAVPDEYRAVCTAVQAGGGGVSAAEREVLEATHGEVGGYLLGLWGLPDALVEAVAFHAVPSEYVTRGLGLLEVVHVADGLARCTDPSDAAEAAEKIDLAFMESAALEHRWPAWASACGEAMGSEEAA